MPLFNGRRHSPGRRGQPSGAVARVHHTTGPAQGLLQRLADLSLRSVNAVRLQIQHSQAKFYMDLRDQILSMLQLLVTSGLTS